MPGPAPDKSTDPLGLVGTLIDDRYRVERLIGRGGMGYVYEAIHQRIQRPVAVKVLSLVQARRRFEREALATARIDHPNSVRLSDFGQLENGTLYLVMELLEGESLGDALDKHSRIERTRALRLCRDVLRALKHAHKLGVVHRDIKPDNVFLCQDAEGNEVAKVLDFGIAKLISDATAAPEGETLTEAGMAIGTPTYMSPEQGFGSGIDGRTDLYSLTVLLFEMLTGRPPFRAKEPLETLRLHISTPPPSLAERAPDVSHPALERLVADGLAKKADERIASAEEYIERIGAVLDALAEAPATPAPKPAPSAPVAPTPAASAASATPAPEELVNLTPSLELAAAVSATAPVDAVAAIEPEAAASRSPMRWAVKLWPLWAAALAVVIIILVVGDSGSDKSPTQNPGAAAWSGATSAALTPTALSKEAEALLAGGRAKEAVELLKASETLREDPAALLALGHAQLAQKKTKLALTAYRRAIAKLDAAGRDPGLVTNLVELIDGRSRSMANEALDVLIDAATPPANAASRDALATIASGHRKRAIREPALAAARRLDIELDEVAVQILALEQGRRCKDRLAAVERLRDLGDKAAIEPLRKAERRMSGGLMGIGSKNINSCLKEAAREAVLHLEQR